MLSSSFLFVVQSHRLSYVLDMPSDWHSFFFVKHEMLFNATAQSQNFVPPFVRAFSAKFSGESGIAWPIHLGKIVGT